MSSTRQDRKTKTTARKDVTQSRSPIEPEASEIRLGQDENDVMPEQSAVPPAKRKRRPKKIASTVEETLEAIVAFEPVLPNDVTLEVEALKSKVREIEAQVQEILRRPTSQGPARSARRRTRHQKISTVGDVGEPDEQVERTENWRMEGAAKELQRLQGELEVAQEDLVSLKRRKDKKRAPGVQVQVMEPTSSQVDNEDGVEDITRTHDPEVIQVPRPRPLGRSVTLTGAYRLPIPVGVSDAELDAISRGIKSAQTIARSFIDASAAASHRTQQQHRTELQLGLREIFLLLSRLARGPHGLVATACRLSKR